ncbi:LacI family DNA-binding transcriptional regulator [Arthrobacter sp. K5]|jgi:LacI family transcriptional regulator|uniref:LacI family DNA-binding transcriptional regulator n=1 Tax=Arthrobacter sp. K5 TaxID=2839623 RepID=A0AAU8ELJ9_9MICC
MSEQVKRATIGDVALHAGVSKAAVSKVLRGAYGVSEAMKARVEASMAALGYRPSALARGMRGSSFTLGVFVVDLQNTFMSVLIEGIRAEAEVSGYQVFIGEASRGLSQQQQMIEAMLDRKMDGLLLIAPFGTAEDLEEIGRSTPTVVLGRHGPSKSYDTVASDDVAGSGLIVDHLAALGHRRIAHLKHVGRERNEDGMPQVVRARGYVEAMVRNGLESEIDLIEGRWHQAGGQRAMELMLERPLPPTAVHAGTDMAALGALTALHEAGIRVPEEFSVVGYDNVFAASLPQVALTSVDQSGVEMGSLAAKLLVERIQGRREAVSTVVAPSLVVRRTTGQAPAAIAPAGRS